MNILNKFDNSYNKFLKALENNDDEQEIINIYLLGNRSNIAEDSVCKAIINKKFIVAEYMLKNKKIDALFLFLRFLKSEKIEISVIEFFKDVLTTKHLEYLDKNLPEHSIIKELLK